MKFVGWDCLSRAALRELLSARVEFLGAIRLPNDAFLKNAHTEVTTDLIMLRHLRAGERPCGPSWKATENVTNAFGETLAINEYFASRPEMMLGQMRLAGRMYRDHDSASAD